MRELENIRQFLTGNAITLVLDLLFSVVFIGVMLLYSGWLTLVVVLSLPCYLVLSLGITPLLRARLHEKFNRGAENQAFLVETINGIDTVKAMAVEPQMMRRWDRQLAAYVAAGFRTATLGTLAHEGVSLIGKLVTLVTMWLGARLVMDGSLSLGQLIAFNMLAGRVATPVMRLAQLWTDFQQTGISVQRLGDILNTRTELAKSDGQGARSGTALPPLAGRIEFDDVVFRYRPDGPEVLRGIRLAIAPGEVIGIVGRSGSGKSTLAKLAQRLYLPERGRVLVDGIDLAMADSSSLRRQIGVVLQENMLFNRTIRDNIALSDPGLPIEAVMAAAKTGRRARIHPRTARSLRHPGRRTRRHALRRPAPAHRHRPRPDRQPANTDFRRSHQRARLRVGAHHPEQHEGDLPGPHGDRHRPPPIRRARCQPHHRHRPRPDRRAGQPRRTAAPRGGALLAAVPNAAGVGDAR
jgi:subfamily B ATP-binding cassette protein HlyB/CyaB